jgi:hypothetical protein
MTPAESNPIALKRRLSALSAAPTVRMGIEASGMPQACGILGML